MKSLSQKRKGVKEPLASRYGYRIITRMQVVSPQARHSLNAGIASTPSRNSCIIGQDKSGYHVLVFIRVVPGFNMCCGYA